MKHEYEIFYHGRKDTSHGTMVIFARDNNDARAFFRNIYNAKYFAIKSIHLTHEAKVKLRQERRTARKSAQIELPLVTLTEEQSFQKMLDKALQQVEKAPHSGLAIGGYLKLFMSANPTSTELHSSIVKLVQLVENYRETLVQNKRL